MFIIDDEVAVNIISGGIPDPERQGETGYRSGKPPTKRFLDVEEGVIQVKLLKYLPDLTQKLL